MSKKQNPGPFGEWLSKSRKTKIAPPIAVGIILAFSLFVAVFTVNLSKNNLTFSEASKNGGSKAEITGTLEVTIFDHEDPKKVKTLVELKEEKTNKKYKIEIPGDLPEKAKTGDKVKIKGKKKDDNTIQLSQANGVGEIQTLSSAQAAVSGDQKTIVMLVNYSNANISCTPSTVESYMFTDPNNKSIDDLYQESSYRKLSLSGTVVGPYTINYTTTSPCDYYAWSSAAESMATAQGVNLADYPRRVFMFPSANGCGYSGIGNVGGNPSRSWVWRCDLKDVTAHEMGHNFGMGHASTATDAYGDRSDIMGYSGLAFRQFNAPHKEQMGWVSNGTTISAPGRYELAPLESDPASSSKPLILRLPKSDTGDTYYLSYRQPIGFDATLGTNYQNVLNIHKYRGGSSQTYIEKTLTDGASFTDTVNGITITQVSHSASGVVFDVNFTPVCQKAAPSLSISPTSASGSAGTTLTYNLTLKNNDNSNCSISTISVSPSLPVNWSHSGASFTETMNPGASVTRSFTITSDSTAPSGTYNITETATQNSLSATASASYVIPGTVTPPPPPTPDTTAPTITISKPVNGSKVPAKGNLSITAAGKDNVAITKIELYLDTTLVKTCATASCKGSASVSAITAGTHTITAKAYDASGNMGEASVSVVKQ